MRRISFDTYDNYETSYSKELHICGTIELKRFAEIRHKYDMFLSTKYPYIESLK